MATVKFNLRDQNAKKETGIYLIFRHQDDRFKWSTGLIVHPKEWNDKTQRVRERMEVKSASAINAKLNDYKSIITKLFEEQKSKGTSPTATQLKQLFLIAIKNPAEALREKSFWDYYNQFAGEKRVKNSADIYKDYNNSLRKHLTQVEQRHNLKLNFTLLHNQEDSFIDKMNHYLTYDAPLRSGEFGLAVNTIGKQFKNLKAFLNWCFDKQIVPPFSLKHMVTITEEVDKVYLKEEEIDRLAELELENETLIKVRDLFLIGCETALRFSDFTRIKAEHIVDDNLIIKQKKTGGKVIIPISSRLKSLFTKYHNAPPSFSNITEFNKGIRQLCELAAINSPIVVDRKRGKTTQTDIIRKYDLVSSHTCRRSFCTNKFLKGMPAQAIMKFSGHKTERAFMRYLKLDAEVVAEKYRDFF